jgi:hypothetical protein
MVGTLRGIEIEALLTKKALSDFCGPIVPLEGRLGFLVFTDILSGGAVS